MKLNVLFVLVLLFSVRQVNAAYKYSVQTGNWGSGSTWSGGSVPACGDSILITASHTVTVNSQVTYNCSSRTSVVVKGVLNFDGGKKLTMPCDSRVYIMGGGEVTADGGGNSNRIEICGSVLWSASQGNIFGPSCLPSTLPGCSLVMPIELLDFNASQCGNKVCINWSTATERNNDYFTVQKLSEDVFTDLVKVESKSLNGNSKRLIGYETKDEEANQGVQYYRLKQVDIDGSFSTSKIVAVDFKTGISHTQVYPNPSSGDFTLQFPGTAPRQVNILDCSGSVVLAASAPGSDHMEIKGLAKGFYYCIVNSQEKTEITKIVVQ